MQLRPIVLAAAAVLAAGCSGSPAHPARASAPPAPPAAQAEASPAAGSAAGKPCTRAQLGKRRGPLTCRAQPDPELGFKAMTWQP
jgi:hypothetical protein